MQDNIQQKTALILLIDDRVAALAQDTIKKMGHRCVHVRDQKAAVHYLENEPVDLFLCKVYNTEEDYKLFEVSHKVRPYCRGVAIIDASLEDHFLDLLLRGYPQNLIADNHPLDYVEVESTIQKILGEDIFGIDKYGIPARETITITRTDQKYEIIEKAKKFFLGEGIQERMTQNIELILNELIMNAIFDAPVNEKGERIYLDRDRNSVFELASNERPVVQYGLNDNSIAISVMDPFGSIQKEMFYSYVNRCFAKKSSMEAKGKGAGLGLFMVFKSLNKLVINVHYHEKTEIVALIDYRTTFRELKKKRRSFHFFHLGGC